MKQTKHTEEEKIALEHLQIFIDSLKSLHITEFSYRHERIKFMKTLKQKLGIKQDYQTLREYLDEISCGAYHRFFFKIQYFNETLDVKNVSGTEDFARLYNVNLLDKFYVTDDKREEFGSNCENYECDHYLTLEPK